MPFNSNDYPLFKEYRTRMMTQAEQDHLAEEARPNIVRRTITNRKRLALIVIVLAAILFTAIQQVAAQEGLPGFHPGEPSVSATSLFQVGIIHFRQGNYEQAVIDFTQAIDIRPDFGSAYAGRALAHYHLEEYDQAIADHTQAIVIFPGYASAYNFRARAHLANGSHEQAIADSLRAAQLNSGYANPHWTRGDVYLELEDYDQALVSYERYLELAGDDADAQVVEQIRVLQRQLRGDI